MNVFHVETGQIQCVRGFTFTLATLFTDYRSTDTALTFTVGSQTVVSQLTGEVLAVFKFQRLHLIVFETVACTYATALLDIQLVRRFVPYVTHIVDAEVILNTVFFHQDMTLGSRLGDDSETDTGFFHQLFERLLVLHLYQDTRVFSE